MEDSKKGNPAFLIFFRKSLNPLFWDFFQWLDLARKCLNFLFIPRFLYFFD